MSTSTALRRCVSVSKMIAGTLQTDPRSGGIKRNSDVNVLPIVAESKFLHSFSRATTTDKLVHVVNILL